MSDSSSPKGGRRPNQRDSSSPNSSRSRAGAFGALLVVAGLLVGLFSATAAAQEDGPLVDILEVDGVIDRTVASYLESSLDAAAADGAEVVVLQLDTPGSLGVDVERLVGLVAASEVPVVVWVGPPGARATEGGALIATQAHVLALSPGSVLGPATDRDLGEPLRPVEGPVHLVLPPALEAVPPGIDLPAGVTMDDLTVARDHEVVGEGVAAFVAPTLPDVLRELDGREVTVGGAARVLDVDPVEANIRFRNQGLLRRVLHTASSPALAYLLIVGGMMAMLFELYQPGFGVAGLSGLAVFSLGGYGLWVLPTNWLALAALVAGMLLLSLDLSLGRLGALTAAGTAAMVAGSVWLFPGPDPLRLSGWLIAIAVLASLVYFVAILTTVLRAQGNVALSGAENLVGQVGVVRSMLNPEGHVFIDGALWRARAPEGAGKVPTGTAVRVTGLDDRLTLEVELDAADEGHAVPSGG